MRQVMTGYPERPSGISIKGPYTDYSIFKKLLDVKKDIESIEPEERTSLEWDLVEFIDKTLRDER